MINWFCIFGVHTWGKWLHAKWTAKYYGEMEPRTGDAQIRFCEKCGKEQMRKL